MDFIQFTEIAMLILFGASWPFNIIKSWRSRTAKGKSLVFAIIIIGGYAIGLSGKLVSYVRTGVLEYSVWFYIADIAMVLIDIILYIRNTRLDQQRAAG